MLSLDQNEIHLWTVPLNRYEDLDSQQRCLATLSAEEKVRSQRFYFEHHRQRFIATRGIARSVLSRYCENIRPQDWCFKFGSQGKPAIDSPLPNQPLFFNISHSKNRICIAVARHSDLGVDVEAISKKRKIVKIAQRYFSPAEVDALLCLPKEQYLTRFYDLWTLKESYIKACGDGLIIPLRKFAFEFPRQRKIKITFDRSLGESPDDWNFWQFDDGNSYRLALALKTAIRREDFKITTRELLSLSEESASEIALKCSTE